MLKLKMTQDDYSVFLESNESTKKYMREIQYQLGRYFIHTEWSKKKGKSQILIDKGIDFIYTYNVLKEQIKPFCETNNIEFDLIEITEPPERSEKYLDSYDIDTVQELDPSILEDLLNDLIDNDALDYDSLMYELSKYEND